MQQVEMGKAIKNDSWISDPEETKDPEVLPELPGFLIRSRMICPI